MFRDLKKLAEVTASEEKPEFDAGQLDFKSLSLYSLPPVPPSPQEPALVSLHQSPSTLDHRDLYIYPAFMALITHISYLAGSTSHGNFSCHVYDLFPSPGG